MVLPTEPEVEVPKDLATGLATSPIKVVTQVVPTTGLVVKLADPLIPSDQAEGERWYMLVVTALVRRLNLEATGVILGDTVTTSAGGVAFEYPQMVAVLPGPIKGCHHRGTGREGYRGRTTIKDITNLPKEKRYNNCL